MTMSNDAPALFVGDVALDEYFAADRWVAPGNKALIETLESYIGGSIANAARVHARLGGATEFLSLLNRGELTNRMLAALATDGVTSEHMLYDDTIGDPRNLIFLTEGEHVVFTPDVDDRPMRIPEDAFQELLRPGFVYTTLNRAERLRSGTLSALEVVTALREAGRRFVFDLDVDGLDDGDTELLRGAHLVMMNDRGFEKSFGANATEHEIREWLRANRVGVLLRSQAAKGATAYTPTGTVSAPGYAVSVVDVTGAGDTLGGGIVFALGQGWPLDRVIDFAVAAASRSVTRMGPNGGIATVAEVEDFAREAGSPLMELA